jgi:hypothetical protein
MDWFSEKAGGSIRGRGNNLQRGARAHQLEDRSGSASKISVGDGIVERLTYGGDQLR